MSAIRLRADLESLPAYKPGKTASEDALPTHKLSSNENPFGPLESVTEAIRAQVGSVNRYPEMAAHELVNALSTRFGVLAEEIVLGSGSVEIVSQLMRATASAGDEIIYAWRSFEAYPLLTIAAGAKPVPVPLDDQYRHDLIAMANAVTDRTRLILICTPNNPTGTTVSETELDGFMRLVPRDVIVVLDEAYVHFDRGVDSPVGIDFFRRYPNIVIAHTFSKAHGLAGLRVGYAIAPATVATALRKVALPFGVTGIAQKAAVASLAAEEELQQRVDQIVLERNRISSELTRRGWRLPESQANFLYFPLGEDTTSAAEVFEENQILVRPFSGDGLRVSIGEKVANDAILATTTQLADRGLTGGLLTR